MKKCIVCVALLLVLLAPCYLTESIRCGKECDGIRDCYTFCMYKWWERE